MMVNGVTIKNTGEFRPFDRREIKSINADILVGGPFDGENVFAHAPIVVSLDVMRPMILVAEGPVAAVYEWISREKHYRCIAFWSVQPTIEPESSYGVPFFFAVTLWLVAIAAGSHVWSYVSNLF